MDNASVGAQHAAPLPADRASPAPPAIADFACQISLERPDSKLSAAKPHLCRSLLLSQTAPGEEIVAALGRQLEAEFGRGFGEKNLWRMVQFAEVFPDKAKVYIDFEEAGKRQKAA